MKLYAITIRPLSGFGTSLKGDTIFGQFCWEVAHDSALVNGGLKDCLASYNENPFVVFSSAYPTSSGTSTGRWHALKRPDVPHSYLWKDSGDASYKKVAERKERKNRKWMITDSSLTVTTIGDHYASDGQLVEKVSKAASGQQQFPAGGKHERFLFRHFPQPHNSINRLTNTTGTGAFAPYSQEITFYLQDLNLVIFSLVDTDFTDIDRVVRGLERIGAFGFGKDASIGIGRFSVIGYEEIAHQNNPDCNAVYCLGPCVPARGSYSEAFFLPFVRFGKHGNTLAQSPAPFKNPVIMADEGAVFMPKDSGTLGRGYFGSSVTGVSKAMPQAVSQGYSITIPFKLEAPK